MSAGVGGLVVGNTSFQNGRHGLSTGSGSGALVQRNVLRDNAVYAVAAGNESVCRDNAISSPFAGPATLSCERDGGGNACNGASGCR